MNWSTALRMLKPLGILLPASALFAFCTGAAAASDRCDAVLTGDLFNRVITSNNSNASSRDALRAYVFTLSESEAYDVYSKEYESGKSQGLGVGVGVNYFGIGGDVDFKMSYDRKLSENEFKEKFTKAKAVYQSQTERMTSSDSALASAYASYVRDPGTIEAWKACVLQDQKPGIYAFGSRDDSGTPYVNIIWTPGHFAGIAPTIRIDFATPRGVSIADGARELGIGSGRTFRVDFDDHKAGFAINVNAEIKSSDDRLLASFSVPATIPPVRLGPPELPTSQDPEAAAFSKLMGSRDCRDVVSYLTEFPNGGKRNEVLSLRNRYCVPLAELTETPEQKRRASSCMQQAEGERLERMTLAFRIYVYECVFRQPYWALNQ